MAQSIRDVMTMDPITCPSTATVRDAARMMRDSDVGDVLVERDGKVAGIVTDRDIVVRTVADGTDPNQMQLGEICTSDVVTLGPDATVEQAVALMRERALRRLPVCEDGRAIGIVSIGDLAIERDDGSALADISAAPPNN